MTELTENQIDEIRTALGTGKLHAIKLYKDLTGASLIDSKNFVESLGGPNDVSSEVTGDIAAGGGLSDTQMDEVLDLLAKGQKLAAIRVYRESSGKRLRESKVFVEELIDQLQLQMPAGKGCASILLFIVVGYGVLELIV